MRPWPTRSVPVRGRANRAVSITGVLIAVAVVLAVGVAAAIVVRSDPTGRRGSGLSGSFEYDLQRLRQIDPELIAFEKVAAIPTGLDRPRAIAVDAADRIYIGGDSAVRVLDAEGRLRRQIETTAPPRCLAVADDRTLYVGTQRQVEVYDADGGRRSSWQPLDEQALITSIATHGVDVFVADAGNRVVVRYDTTGDFIQHIGRPDPARGIPGILVPSPHFDLTVVADGLLAVVNPGRHRIETYTPDGELTSWWGRASNAVEGFAGCCNPTDIAILPDGRFVTSEKGLERVKVYRRDGQFEGVVAAPAFFEAAGWVHTSGEQAEADLSGLDLATDSKGRVLVLDPVTRTVWIFAARVPPAPRPSGTQT